MKSFHTRFTIILSALALLLSGCEKKEQVTLTPDRQILEATAKGGKLTITYQLNGSSADISVSPKSEEDWINGFDTSVPGKIDFNVDRNDSPESREGHVTIEYSGKETKVTVKQAGHKDEFDIVASSTPSSISYCIVPQDKTMTYMYSIMDKETYQKYGNPEEIYNEDLARFKESADKFGKTLEDYLEGLLYSGDSKVTTLDLIMPSTEFYVYVYGIKTDGEKTTSVIVSPVSTKEIEKIDPQISISHEMNGNLVTVTIAPANESQTYIWNTVRKKDMSKDLVGEKQAEIFSKVESYRNNGMSDSDILSYLAVKGTSQKELKLEIETEYVSYAIAIDNSFLLVSDPVTSEFKTPGYEVSDNILTMEMRDIRGHYGKCCITPSNDDPYVVFCKEFTEWEGMSDEEIIESLTAGKDLTNKRVTGYYEVYSRGFKEQTKYAFVAFGYNNKMPTTKLYKAIFTTTEAEISKEVKMSISYDKYYDGTELENMYPDKFKGASGNAVLPISIKTEGYVIDCLLHMLPGDFTQEGTDDQLIQKLIYEGMRGTDDKILVIPYDNLYTIIGVANDIMGDYTKVIREKISLTKDGVTPAEEYPAE